MDSVVSRIQVLEDQAAEASVRFKELETRLVKSEAHTEKLEKALLKLSDTTPWRRTMVDGQDMIVEEADVPERIKDLSFKLPFDIYSVIAFKSCATLPFWFSLIVILGLQIALLVLLLVDQLGSSDDGDSWLGLPSNVETTVRVAQSLSLIIALFSQDDLRVGIEGIFEGAPTMFKGNMCFHGMNSVQWSFAYLLRFLQGFLGLCASFVLLVKSETVFDVLLNFLGVQFVSNLDDLAFTLGMLGYFGKSVRETTNNVAKASFFRVAGRASSCLKSFAHVIGLFAVLVAMAIVFAFLAIQQDAGAYSVSHVRVTFGDEVLPYLGLFNGCYKAKEGESFNRRLIYEQVGYDGMGGKFVYCDDGPSEGWVFSVANTDDACDDYFVRSGGTNTFDIVQVGEMREWYTDEGLLLESAQILNVQQPDAECGSRVFEQSKSACEEIFVEGNFGALVRAPSFQKLQVDSSVEGDRLNDMTLSHPIYHNTSTSELVLFTGRRWIVIAKQGVNSTTDLDWLSYFYEDYGFQALKTNPFEDWAAVKAISEIVETATGTPSVPLGLQWYSTRYDSESAFPFPDLTRPQDGTFGCSYCNNENPCFFNGICQDDGSCHCVDRTSGYLCRDPPLSDGICDVLFNNELYNYDGGDCCAATCDGLRCGGNMSSVFGYDAGYLASVPHRGDAFDGTRETRVAGFDHCVGPDMASYQFEIGPFPCDAVIPEVSVICGGEMYLLTPTVDFENVMDFDDCVIEKTANETIRVPFGIVCDATLGDGVGYAGVSSFSVYYRYGTHDLFQVLRRSYEYQIWLGSYDYSVLSWALPSKCTIEALSELVDFEDMINATSKPGQAIINLSRDSTWDELCKEDKEVLVERYALTLLNASMFESIGNTNEDHCNWNGISCVGGRVVGLGRDDYLKDGFVPTEIGLLTNLQYIYCEDCGISTLPTEIGMLTKLTYLALLYNSLSSIPSEIGNLTRLFRLDLKGNWGLANLPNEMANLHSLRELDLQDTFKNARLPLSVFQLTSLSSLHLQGSSFGIPLPTEIGLMTNLASLSMTGMDVTGSIPSEIGLMTSLTSMILSSSGLDVSKLTGSIPSSIGLLTRLAFVFLDDNALTGSIPSSIGLLANLETLMLSSNLLTGSIPASIKNLSQLTRLNLESNDLSGVIPILPSTIVKDQGGSITCSLSGNNFTDVRNAIASGCFV